MAAEDPAASTGGTRTSRKSVFAGIAAVAVVFLIVFASLGLGVLPLFGTSNGSRTSSIAGSTGGLSVPPALCSDLTQSQELADGRVMNSSAAGFPGYDEQLWLGFEQNFTRSISYNVTVLAQNDSFGFGPVYLLNGLTDAGYWYQVGIGWDLASGSGTQYNPGFTFLYEVWNVSTASPVFPEVGVTLPQPFFAKSGDAVLLSLNVGPAGQVSMTAYDWNTSARATESYGGFGDTQFLGFKEKASAFPTSLVTEWYHALPYFCSDEPAVYSNQGVAVASAWLRIDEWNLTGVSTSQRFNSSDAGQCCVFSTGDQGVEFQNPASFQSLTTNGTTVYANAREFVSP